MFDKEILKKRFEKSLKTYDENALVQIKMAKELVKMLPEKKYKNILEIGCGSGILTKAVQKNIEYKTYDATDIVEKCREYISANFFQSDIDTFEPDKKYDLIISNAALQWSLDLNTNIRKLMTALNPKGVLAFSIFGKKNMSEIKEIFKVGLNYPSVHSVRKTFSDFEIITLEEEIQTLEFENLIEILKHLKTTGVNVFKSTPLSKSSIEKYCVIYEERFKNKLTYHPVYAIFKNFG